MRRKRYKFCLKEVFPLKDNVAIILIRFMAAFNDLQAIFECYKRHNKDLENKIDQEINLAKRCYFFRLTCGHLYEVLKIFNTFKDNEHLKKLVANMKDVGKEAHDNLLKMPADFHKQICKIRNNCSFHYPNEKAIKRAIRDFAATEESNIISSKTYKGTRFIVADDIMSFIVDFSVGRKFVDMEKMIKQVADAQGQLFQFIDCLFLAYLEDRKLTNRIRVVEVP